jgi:hypothetical protein
MNNLLEKMSSSEFLNELHTTTDYLWEKMASFDFQAKKSFSRETPYFAKTIVSPYYF